MSPTVRTTVTKKRVHTPDIESMGKFPASASTSAKGSSSNARGSRKDCSKSIPGHAGKGMLSPQVVSRKASHLQVPLSQPGCGAQKGAGRHG